MAAPDLFFIYRGLLAFLKVDGVMVCLTGSGNSSHGVEGDEELSRLIVGLTDDHAASHFPAVGFIRNEEALSQRGDDNHILHWECDPANRAAHRPELFRSNYLWLDQSFSTLPVNNLPLRLDSQVLTYQTDEHGTTIFTEHFKVAGGDLRSVDVAWLDGETGRLTTTEMTLWERRGELGGIELVNTMLAWKGFSYLDDDGKGGLHYTGVMGDLLSILETEANFTTKLIHPADDNWGAQEGDDWIGMVGELSRGKADLSTSGLAISPERKEVLDYSIGVVEDMITLVKLVEKIDGDKSKMNMFAYALAVV